MSCRTLVRQPLYSYHGGDLIVPDSGSLYFISDEFFSFIQDPYLKINHSDSKRPHYFAFRDPDTGLYWMVPCSSKIEKFEQLIINKRLKHKPTDSICIVKIFGHKFALLFQEFLIYYIMVYFSHQLSQISIESKVFF